MSSPVPPPFGTEDPGFSPGGHRGRRKKMERATSRPWPKPPKRSWENPSPPGNSPGPCRPAGPTGEAHLPLPTQLWAESTRCPCFSDSGESCLPDPGTPFSNLRAHVLCLCSRSFSLCVPLCLMCVSVSVSCLLTLVTAPPFPAATELAGLGDDAWSTRGSPRCPEYSLPRKPFLSPLGVKLRPCGSFLKAKCGAGTLGRRESVVHS